MTAGPSDPRAESETRFRTMADHAPVLLWMAGPDARCAFFNEGWLRFTGRALAAELGSGWAAGIHPEDFQRAMHTYLDAFVARRSFSMEYRLRRHDGAYRWIFDQGTPRHEPDGAFVGFIGSCVDITEQREAQEALRKAAETLAARVREREVLLREVHHRVKNDLQVISSLLGIQARQLGEPRAIAALEDCQTRVEAIALAHEQIYLSDDLGKIPFAPYLRRLAAGLIRSVGPAPATVEIDVDADDVLLPVGRAIPCGLIVQELVTNALRHGFPGVRGGRIDVALRARAAARLELVVADDGVGLPPGFDVATATSMGWRLIAEFAEQLQARLTIDRRRGTTVRIELAAEPHDVAPHRGVAG